VSVRAAAPDVPAGAALDVPFLPQTELLCGGAAAAMVFRYWGERRAGVRQFEPLVDRRAGGIPADSLAAAIAARGWTTERVDGTLEAIGAHLSRGQPLILLIEVRPRRYHFVVAVDVGPDNVVVHDPAVGPSRRYSRRAFAAAWSPAGNWALSVRPGAHVPGSGTSTLPLSSESPAAAAPAAAASRAPSPCEHALAEAVDTIRAEGLRLADELLGAVRSRCPASSGPISELAGVRFAERRWHEAEALAEEAVGLDPSDEYAWDVLGSSRFVQNDEGRALEAWNVIGRPRVDSVQIEGLALTRYALVAEALGLVPGEPLTRHDLEAAARRLDDLPTRSSSRVDYVPEGDGWTTVRAAIVERSRRPHGWLGWASAAAASVVDREVTVNVPGWSGQGELWTASWRFWPKRPRVAFGLKAPRTGRLPGVVAVELSHASQTYASDAAGGDVVQDQLHAGVSLGHWVTSVWRYEASGGVDRWDGDRTAASAALAIDRRFARDRVGVTASGRHFWPLDGGRGFRLGSVGAAVQSSTAHDGLVLVLSGGYRATSSEAPLALWPVAGDQTADSLLLRAHPLTENGIVEGEGFGRRLASLTAEGRRWLARPSLVRLAVAGFVDVARATGGLRAAADGRVNADAGLGLRVRVPGRDGVIRVDYAVGLSDRAWALTVGWTR
jgi:hypothetical protein